MKQFFYLLAVASLILPSISKANIITQDLTVTPLGSPVLSGEGSRLFTLLDLGILDPSFDPSSFFARVETLLGFSVNSTTNRVEVTERSENGVVTRTTSQIETTTTRELLSVVLNNVQNLLGFTADRISQNGTALFIDFSDIDISADSFITLGFSFSSESVDEIINSEIETIGATTTPTPELSAVSAPNGFALLVMPLLIGFISYIRLR
jgi:hypothetical protein